MLFGILVVLLLLLAVNDKNWKPLKDKFWWNVTANYSKNGALRAIDHNLKTRWSSYAPMASGMFFQVDVGKATTMNGVLLQVDREERRGQPLSWQLKGSLNGKDWYTLEDRPGLTYKGMLVIPFKAVQARYIQIIQTSINQNPSPWMIYEIALLQPVVPWQFSRATLLNAIVAWLLVMLSVTLFGGRKGSVFLTFGMIAILLIGWCLRVSHLPASEFSEHEYRFFQRLAFDRYTQGEWLRTYWASFNSGAYWLFLLLIRLAHQFWQTPLAAFRVVSGIFSLGAVTAVFFVWKELSQSQERIWEAALFSALLSVSAWQALLSRGGDFSGSVVCVFLPYLLLAYSFLYLRASLWLASGLAVLFCLGIFLHPVMGLAPIGILLFGIWHLWLCRYAPTFFAPRHLQSFRLRHQWPRVLLFLLSTLPGLAYWLVLLRSRFFHEKLSWAALRSFFQKDFGQLLHANGIGGILLWLFWGIALLGLLSLLKAREHGEWFLVSQLGLFLFVLSPFLSDEQHASVFGLLVLLLLCLFLARGFLTLLSLLTFRQRAKTARCIRFVAIGIVAGYAFSFSVLALLCPSGIRADQSGQLADYRQSMRLESLLQQVGADPVECHRSVMLEEEIAAMYKAEYDFDASVRSLADLQRFAKQGIFYFYALVSLRELNASPDREPFFTYYYNEMGRTSQIILYRLREEFSGLPRRYYARDLFSATGRNLRDPLSPDRLVRGANADDRPGFMVFGPFVRICEAGDYVARFNVRLMEAGDQPVAMLKVLADRHEVFGARELTEDDFPDPETYYSFDIPFNLDFSNNPVYPMKRLEMLVDFYGDAELLVESVVLLPGKKSH